MSTWLDSQDAGKVQGWLHTMREHPERFSRVTDYAGGDEGFGLWLYLVDRRISRAVGVGLFDLADCCTRDMYEGGYSPRDAAIDALLNDDTFAELVTEAGLA